LTVSSRRICPFRKGKKKKSLFTDVTVNEMLKGAKEVSNQKTGNLYFLHLEQVSNCEQKVK